MFESSVCHPSTKIRLNINGDTNMTGISMVNLELFVIPVQNMRNHMVIQQ